MFAYFSLLLNVVILFYTFSSFSDKKKIIVPLAEAISVFLCLYSVTSGIMWMFDAFSVEFSLLAVTILDLIVFTFVYFKSSVKGLEFFKIEVIKINYRVFFNRLAIFVAVFLSIGAYSTMGIGYNDGNAQIQAVTILNGNNSRKFEIKEYENIPEDSQYEYFFFDSISNIDRENSIADYWLSISDTDDGKTYKMMGEFVCNPVYPSILALSANLFGIWRMAFIQAIFAFCLFVFVDEILKALKCEWKLRSVLVLLLGVSPIIVYCNHTTLVEPIIGFCMIFFMYFLLCKNNKLQILSALGVVAFSFIHSSVYTMIPLFLILYWMFYIHSGKYKYLISSGIAVIGYILSFVFLNIVASERTSLDYRKGMSFLGNNYYLFVVAVAVISVIAITILIISNKLIQSSKFSEFRSTKGKKIFKILMICSSIVPVIMTVIIFILKCNAFSDFLKITFISFTVCSGVVLVPVILFKLVTAKYEPGIKEAAVLIGFVYTIILYSSIMKVIIEDYYYDARYLSSFIPFIILATGIMIRLNKKEEMNFIIPVISIIILVIPYTASLLTSGGEARIETDIYEDVMEKVEGFSDENTVILIEKPLLKYFYYPLLAANAKVYPMAPEYCEIFYYDNEDNHYNIIYITDDNGNGFIEKGLVLYSKINNSSSVKIDSISNISKTTGLPIEFIKYPNYRIQAIKLDELYNLLDYSKFEELTWDNVQYSIDDVEIDEDEIAHVTVSISDPSKFYVNDIYMLSYHLEYENEENIYDLPRRRIGTLVTGDYSFDFDLSNQNGDMTVIFDMVEEGVAWYSWTYDVPTVVFSKGEDGWDYTVGVRKTN